MFLMQLYDNYKGSFEEAHEESASELSNTGGLGI